MLFCTSSYVVRALRWLKHHNTLYRDIEIEEITDDASSSQAAVNEIALDDAGESSQKRLDNYYYHLLM